MCSCFNENFKNMGLFQDFLIYIVFITFFLYTNAQNTDLNLSMNECKKSEKTLVNEIIGNAQKDDLDSHIDNKRRKEIKPLNLRLDSKGSSKEFNSNFEHKGIQKLPNFVIDTKPRTIPIRIPLVIKTANVKPAPAHYKRLKADTERKKPSKHNSNKEISRKRVTPIDMVTPKSTSNSRKHKHKNTHFFEEDSNVNSLPPVSKSSNRIKQKKPTNKSDTPVDQNSEKVLNKEINQRANKIETDIDNNETINIENGTHPINITKSPEPIQIGTESKILIEEDMPKDTPLTLTPEEIKEFSTPNAEDVTLGIITNEDGIQHTTNKPDKNMEPILKDYPVTVDDGIDSADIITIKDHKYEECEETLSPTVHSESINVNENINNPWCTQALNSVYRNPYGNAFQNYHTAYDTYLNCMADNNPITDDGGNFNSRSDILELPTSTTAFSQIVTTPETEEIQDIYGPKLKTSKNVIDILPENVLGRVWRTWKNTEVEIRKPYHGVNRPFCLGRNWNTMNYGDINAKTPALYGPQVIGVNGYYNINKAWPYSYSNNRNL